MNKLKFRAWDGKEMLYNVSIIDNWGAIKKGYSGTPWIDEANAGDIMQYIRITDKNNKEICEGDIIKIVALLNDHHQKGAIEIRVVKYFSGNYCLCLKNNETGIPIFPFNVTHELEIIGNIFENINLLDENNI